ncbi:MAG: hypothetical protein QNL91_08825 [Candidatus Krumholzibacteria bacterium]|nr:hypothetical protein [Candidatus Krumholzibacteria bacterium]
MSTRQLLNMTMGAIAMLLLAAIGVVFSTTGSNGDQNAPIELAVRQQILVQDLTRQAVALSDAEDREAVTEARENLSRTIMQFDRNLSALLHGGTAVDANGQTVVIDRTGNDLARIALQDGAHLWLETGLPLADLAAGEFSVFSAAGQKATKGLQNNSVELMQHMGTAASSLRMGIHARSTAAGIARWSALGLVGVLVGLFILRRKVLTAESHAPVSLTPRAAAPAYDETPAHTSQPLTQRPAGLPSAAPELGSFASPVNFDAVNASVDQMSVDMNTIAGSTEKMRLAIDSVGNALQGMLYSLNEMSQDTAEGHKIVRNANNAASFTADTAGDLAASAREMSAVVARVTQLAQSTKQVAAQIDGEAVHTGKTGEAFTSVVAGEVKGLSRQTIRATMEIEETVSSILLTARQYEEAIGQIIKNVSSINKVSQNLGQLMLSPPATVQPGAPLPTLPALTPVAAEPVPAAEVEEDPAMANGWGDDAPVVEDDPVVVEPTPTEVAADTSAAIEEAIEEPESEGGSNGNVFMLGGRDKKPNALNIPAVPSQEPAAEPAVEEPVAAEPAAEEPADEPLPAPEPEAVPEAKAEPKAEPAEGSTENVFMLNKPKAPAPKDAVEDEIIGAPEPEASAEEEPVVESPEPDVPNVYGLEIPTAEATEAAPAAEPETAETEEREPVLAGGGGQDDEKADASQNVFMLNKPK